VFGQSVQTKRGRTKPKSLQEPECFHTNVWFMTTNISDNFRGNKWCDVHVNDMKTEISDHTTLVGGTVPITFTSTFRKTLISNVEQTWPE